MNLRCIYCQTPFTLSRLEMLNGIITMNEKHQNHYDAHCPRCRRANSISRQRMELFFPNWQAAAKELASTPQSVPPVEAQAPVAPQEEVPATAFLKTEPLPKAAKEMLEKTAPKKAATSSTKEKKPAATKATAAKPPVKEKKPVTASKKPAAATTSKAKKPAAKITESKPKKK
ncbi:hypothetical protein ANAEL_00406 [Anaerolineales bacterium]|nr:hypothetical protein ANAEL_00406 [Anaerolineales bacterium]